MALVQFGAIAQEGAGKAKRSPVPTIRGVVF
jgi:hypothetical protein